MKLRFLCKNRKGNVLIPAVFLLIFVAIFGAVLLRGAVQNITVSARIASIRQAETLAKSATDYICKYLYNANGSELFKDLDTTIEAMVPGAAATPIPLEINTHKVDCSIKLVSRTNASNIITEEFIVKSTAKYMEQTGHSARKMTAERTKSGLGDDKVLGTFKNSRVQDFDLHGESPSSPAKILGPVRVENGKNFQMIDYIIDGDLHVKANQSIVLTNSQIKGTLYLESTSNPSRDIKLTNVKVDGDIIIFTKQNTITLAGNIKCKNLYLDSRTLSLQGGLNITADSIALAQASASQLLPFTLANVFDGAQGAALTASKLRTPVNDPDVDLTITAPASDSDYDFILDNSNWSDFNNATHDLSGDKTLNVKVDKIELLINVNVTGDGTINFWVKGKSPLSGVNINRNGSNAVINFINLDMEGDFSLTDRVLDANIINPYSILVLINSQLRGFAISEQFNFYVIPALGNGWGKINISTEHAWANPGSLPGLGGKGVKYIYGPYIEG